MYLYSMQPTNHSGIRCNVPELSGSNYKTWKERILLYLGWMDIDYALKKYELEITETSTKEEKVLHEQWERSNRLSVMFIKTSISASIFGLVEKHTNVRALLKAIDKQFSTLDKAFSSTLIMKFSSLRLTNVKGVHEHIMKMRDIATQLKTREVDMSNTFMVHYFLNNPTATIWTLQNLLQHI